VFAEVFLEGRVQRDIALIVAKKVELDLIRRRAGRSKSCPVNSRQEKRRSCQTRRACTATESSQVSAKHVARHD
jgi:hypothetical protein